MRNLLTTLSFCLIAFSSMPQAPEIGPFAGVSYYLGDLNPGKHFYLPLPAAGIVHRYIFNPHFAVKNSFLYGGVEGNDSKSGNAFMKKRNLYFRSSILDISSQLEFNFLPFEEKISEFSLTNDSKYLFAPYVFLGISLFSFNPKTKVNDVWVDLQPLGTEGQGTVAYPGKKKYALTQLSIPFGAGIKLDVSQKINVIFEWGLRKTFTDYLDDVSTAYADPVAISVEKGAVARQVADPSLPDPEISSDNTGRQRGNSKNNDWYSFAGVMVMFKIISKYKNQKCPTVNEN